MSTRGHDPLIAPWRESAARLVQMLESSADAELSLAVLKQLTRRFGDHGFPGFLKLLLTVAESSNELARRKLADAVALGLRRGDAPSGVLTSWGATRFWSDRQPLHAGMLPGNLLSAPPRRQLDPIEYLTVWFSQRTHRPYLSESAYHECLLRLVELFNSSPAARALYPLKIEADLAGIEGAFTRQTRQRLGILVETWKQGQPVAIIAAAAAGAPARAVSHLDTIRMSGDARENPS
jgi:hypothetical protein